MTKTETHKNLMAAVTAAEAEYSRTGRVARRTNSPLVQKQAAQRLDAAERRLEIFRSTVR